MRGGNGGCFIEGFQAGQARRRGELAIRSVERGPHSLGHAGGSRSEREETEIDAHLVFRERGPVTMLRALLAGVAQLVEHELPKLGVAGSNPVSRSRSQQKSPCFSTRDPNSFQASPRLGERLAEPS